MTPLVIGVNDRHPRIGNPRELDRDRMPTNTANHRWTTMNLGTTNILRKHGKLTLAMGALNFEIVIILENTHRLLLCKELTQS
jgi:hypothetical protein